MKPWRLKLLGIIALLAAIIGAFVLFSLPHQRALKLLAQTRQTLRQQGFKTDLSDFDFSTSPELRQREVALTALGRFRASGPFPNYPDLMEAIGNDSAIVAWNRDLLKIQGAIWPSGGDEMAWGDFGGQFNEYQGALDAACAAALSGPIRFNLTASRGPNILLPHLATLKNLTLMLTSRTMLALHDGNKDAAWTNLMASTRLVTAWEIEPIEISHLVRFADTKMVFNSTWQALQADSWPDEQLARLQAEWESVNFITNLPETAAFKRASTAATCEFGRNQSLTSRPSFGSFLYQALKSPRSFWPELQYRWSGDAYLRTGSYIDETDLLLFYRDRELELRKAIQSPTWAQMRQLAGITNDVPFQSRLQSKYPLRFISFSPMQNVGAMLQREGVTFARRAAEAEAERRVLTAALALERYRGKHGSYPRSLVALAPEFLKAAPVDFIDGQPLRYRLKDNGHFLLYSIGLDCVDDGGTIPSRHRPVPAEFVPDTPGAAPKGDIVWPLPALTAAVDARRQEQLAESQNRNDQIEMEEAVHEWARTARHQGGVEKLLSAPAPNNWPDPTFNGRPLSEALRDSNATGTNRLTLSEMLTLRQITNGDEPETITFEAPISYNVITNLGGLSLFIDLNDDDAFHEGFDVQEVECERATNGNCLLVWSTLYESPGKHALQAALSLKDPTLRDQIFTGPPLAFTITNLCQFSLSSAHFDPQLGAAFLGRLPETNASYVVELTTTNGTLLKTITGSTSNSILNVRWNLVDDHGQRCTNDSFNSVFHITLPDSGRSQTLRGP